MAMSHLPERVLAQLHIVAHEAAEVFGERGYRIDAAVQLDSSFCVSSRPKSALTRSLVDEGVRIGASRAGVDFLDARGGAVDLRFEVGGRYLVFRVKRARRLQSGEVDILTNAGSTWGIEDDIAIIPDEPWVFAFIASEDGLIELFVAPVYGATEGSPGHLILGPEIRLEGEWGPQGGSFRSDDDDALPGFEQGEGESSGEFGAGA